MNYLAHLYLSGENDEVKLGNFIGDAVKGNNYLKYDVNIQKGVILHRAIDEFIDNHEIPKIGKERFREKYGKHSGIVVDILYDYLLANNWSTYSNVQIDSFIREAYVLLVYNHEILPQRVRNFMQFMIVKNWIGSYKTIDGIKSILERMPKRTSLPNHAEYAAEVIKEYLPQFNLEFNVFFPEIIKHVNSKFDILPSKM